MAKVKAYSESSEGKKRMEECVDTYRALGIKKTAAGTKVLTEEDMSLAVCRLMDCIITAAEEHDVPESVLRHLRDYSDSDICRLSGSSGGKYGAMIFIYFGYGRSRKSLYEEKYEGVDDIVRLFNNGYHAKKYVYGWWDGHSPTGAPEYGREVEGSVWIRSKKDREGAHFIEEGIHDFEGNYASLYNVWEVRYNEDADE
jgi:hypothetical protein